MTLREKIELAFEVASKFEGESQRAIYQAIVNAELKKEEEQVKEVKQFNG